MSRKTVTEFLLKNPNYTISFKDNIKYITPIVASECKSFKHLTLKIDTIGEIEYVGEKFIQTLDGLLGDKKCTSLKKPAVPDSWCNMNCNTNPPNCPPKTCTCDSGSLKDTQKQCTSLKKPSVPDSWCDQNCNAPVPNCPPATCQCGSGPSGPTPAPAPATPTPPPTPGSPGTPTPPPTPPSGAPTPAGSSSKYTCLKGQPSSAVIDKNDCFCNGCGYCPACPTGTNCTCKPAISGSKSVCTDNKLTGAWKLVNNQQMKYIEGGQNGSFDECPKYISDMTSSVNSAVSFRPKSIVNKSWTKLSTGDMTNGVKTVVYVMLDSQDKFNYFSSLLNDLTTKKKNSPWDRFVLGFFRPDVDYTWDTKDNKKPIPKGQTQQFYPGTYKELKDMISTIKTITRPDGKKMEVYLSMGGWNYNCVPLFYVNSFNSIEPQDSKWAAPNWGYKCEPRTTGISNPMYTLNKYQNLGLLHDPNPSDIYTFFFDPAVDDIDDYNLNMFTKSDCSNGNCPPTPAPAPTPSSPNKPMPPSNPGDLDTDIYKGWSIKLKPTGSSMKNQKYPHWNNEGMLSDVANGLKTIDSASTVGIADPSLKANTVYEGFATMAKNVGASGIDLDYEEFWHADSFHIPDDPTIAYAHIGGSTGSLARTKGKLARISILLKWYCLKNNIGLSIPAPAVGVSPGDWYYGNLKGLFLSDSNFDWEEYILSVTGLTVSPLGKPNNWLNTLFDGGVFPMIYDLGGAKPDCGDATNNPPGNCALAGQVPYYLKQYTDNNIQVYIGFEIGRPAYPQTNSGTNPKQNLTLPPKKSDIDNILQSSDYNSKFIKGGFMWEIFKSVGNYTTDTGNACCEGGSCPSEQEQASVDYTSIAICNKFNNGSPCSNMTSNPIIDSKWKYGHCGCKLGSCA